MAFLLPQLLVFLLILLLVSVVAQNQGNIAVGSSLTANGSGSAWLSPSGDFAFGFRAPKDKDLFLLCIWFDKIPDKTVVWYANGDNLAPVGIVGSLLEEIDKSNREQEEKGKRALTALLESLPAPVLPTEEIDTSLTLNGRDKSRKVLYAPKACYGLMYRPKTTKQDGLQMSNNSAFKPYYPGESSSPVGRMNAPPPTHPRNMIRRGGTVLDLSSDITSKIVGNLGEEDIIY